MAIPICFTRDRFQQGHVPEFWPKTQSLKMSEPRLWGCFQAIQWTNDGAFLIQNLLLWELITFVLIIEAIFSLCFLLLAAKNHLKWSVPRQLLCCSEDGMYLCLYLYPHLCLYLHWPPPLCLSICERRKGSLIWLILVHQRGVHLVTNE